MATIVQPYNPWREQLALTALGNVAGSIIGDIWKTHRDNQQNRKINAFRGQLNQDLRDNVSQGQGVSLVPQNLPEGYNSDPWANAFHKTDTPITQFDLGTAGLAQNTQRTPSIRDIMQGVDRLAATPRFSMLGADTVNKIRDDLLQGAYADMFANAGNIGDRVTALAMGAAHGKVPYQVLNAFAPWGIHSTPNHESKIVDAGNNHVVLDYYPKDGSTSVVSVIPKGVNPTNQAVANTNANAHITAANIAANAQRDVANISANARNNNNAGRMVDWHNSVWEAMANDIDKDIATLQSQLDMTRNSEEADRINQKIAALEAQKGQIYASFLTGGYNFGTNGQSGYTPINDAGQYNDLINKYSQKHGVDPDLIAAIIQVESGGRNGLTSSAGAQGIMQIMPATQHYLGITDPFNPEQNIEGGIRYFKEMLDRFGGDTAKALRAYNAGPGNVPKGQMPRYKYVDDVMAIYNRRKSARNNNSNNTQQPPNVSASGNQEQPQSTQNNSTQGNSTTATRTATDPIVMARGNGQNMEVITQSQLDRLIEEAAKEGLSPQIVIQRLINDEGYTYTEKSRGNQPIFSLNIPNTPYIYEPHLPGAVPRKYSVPTQNQTTPNNNSGTVTALGNNSNSNPTPLNRDSPLLNDPIFRDLMLRLFR